MQRETETETLERQRQRKIFIHTTVNEMFPLNPCPHSLQSPKENNQKQGGRHREWRSPGRQCPSNHCKLADTEAAVPGPPWICTSCPFLMTDRKGENPYGKRRGKELEELRETLLTQIIQY